MLNIGLTGSIAVGKSYVCGVFQEFGVPVLDADQISREVVVAGSEGLKKVVREFGSGILQPDGELNRLKLAEIVFSDESKRQLLNSIIHPLVFEAQDKWLSEQAKIGKLMAIIDAALMIESGGFRRFDKIIVVWCSDEKQLERLIERNKLNPEEALKRINAQMPQNEKKAFADFLIDTTDGFDSARSQVTEIFAELRVLV
jgi:dephospho-CoA kinase